MKNQPDWQPSHQAAEAALADFVPRAASYSRLRNYDYGPENRRNISGLSPYLRHRLICERDVCAAVLAAHPFRTVDKFIQEVCWRSYWKGWLQMRPSIWAAYQAELRKAVADLKQDDALAKLYAQAVAGGTGIEGFDDWAKELTNHGYLHNHARMWFASIWIFTLRLPWVLGADFFMRHLLDGDAASNTLSWRWVAGLQTVGKHYLARADNIVQFTDGRFNPKGLNETAGPITPAYPAPDMQDAFLDYTNLTALTAPIERERTLWVMHEDDCRAGIRFAALAEAKHHIAINVVAGRSPLLVSDKVSAFARGAVGPGYEVDTADDIMAFARGHNISQIVFSRPPVGAVNDALRDLAGLAKAEDITVHVATHEWDKVAWPKATKGFFAFRNCIPQLISI